MPTPNPVAFVDGDTTVSVTHSNRTRVTSATELIDEALRTIRDSYHEHPVFLIHPSWRGNDEQLGAYCHSIMPSFPDGCRIIFSPHVPEQSVYIMRASRAREIDSPNRTRGISIHDVQARINHSMVPRNAAPIHSPPRSVAECVDQCVRTIRETYGEEPIALAHPDWRREWGRLGLYIESLVGRNLLRHVALQFSDHVLRQQVWIIRASRLVEAQAPECDHFAPHGRINLGIAPLHSTPSVPPIDTIRATFGTVTQNGQYRARTPTHEEHSPEEQRLEKLLADRIAAGLVDG